MKPIVLTRWAINIQAWLGSATLQAMSMEGEALYLRLCLDQCEHGAARADKEFWRSAYAHRCHDFDRAWSDAQRRFSVTPDGLVDAKVREDNVKSRLEIAAKVDAAIGTNRKRRAKKAYSDAQRTLSERSPDAGGSLHPPSSSSSSSFSEGEMSTSAVAPAPARAPVKPRKPRPDPTGPDAEVITHFQTRYAEAHPGETYAPAWGRDRKLAQEALALVEGDGERVKQRIDRFFALGWYADKHTFPKFKGAWNELVDPGRTNGHLFSDPSTPHYRDFTGIAEREENERRQAKNA